jgi:hypothetical protein
MARKVQKDGGTGAKSPVLTPPVFQGGLLKATLTPARGDTPLHLVVPTSGACDRDAFLAALRIPALLTPGGPAVADEEDREEEAETSRKVRRGGGYAEPLLGSTFLAFGSIESRVSQARACIIIANCVTR